MAEDGFARGLCARGGSVAERLERWTCNIQSPGGGVLKEFLGGDVPLSAWNP